MGSSQGYSGPEVPKVQSHLTKPEGGGAHSIIRSGCEEECSTDGRAVFLPCTSFCTLDLRKPHIHTGQLTTSCNFSFRRSNTFFWLQGAHTYRQHTLTHVT